MSKSLYWLQCGACGGDSMSLLGAYSPSLDELCHALDVELLWHPSLSNLTDREHQALVREIGSGKTELDILCVEGYVARGPSGTGMYDTFHGEPKQNLLATLAAQARYVIAVGTCASFGGFGTVGDAEGTGLQFRRETPGGFLGKDWRSAAGWPVISLPGCPVHHEVLARCLASLVSGIKLPLNDLHAPEEWYGLLVHQGCMRGEYHEYRVEEHDFGERGCLFFHMGCRGPLTRGVCNKMHWNNRSSKTSAGVPCLGCTSPDFPPEHSMFSTPNIAGVPIHLPEGVDRAHYLAYKGMAAAAAPLRLKNRKNRV